MARPMSEGGADHQRRFDPLIHGAAFPSSAGSTTSKLLSQIPGADSGSPRPRAHQPPIGAATSGVVILPPLHHNASRRDSSEANLGGAPLALARTASKASRAGIALGAPVPGAQRASLAR